MDYTTLLEKVRNPTIAAWLDSHEFADGTELTANELTFGVYYFKNPARQQYFVCFHCKRCHHVVIYDLLKDDFCLITLKECK